MQDIKLTHTVIDIPSDPLTLALLQQNIEELNRMREEMLLPYFYPYYFTMTTTLTSQNYEPHCSADLRPRKQWKYSGKHPLDAWET